MRDRWKLWLSAAAVFLVAVVIYLRVCRPEMELERSNHGQYSLIYSGGLHVSAQTRCLILPLAVALFSLRWL